MHHLSPMFRRKTSITKRSSGCQDQVRFFALLRIKPHVPPLVRAPVNSFEFHRCRRTPQVAHLILSLEPWPCIAKIQWASFTAWTTRVSNPVRYPRSRASASERAWEAAFAIGVPSDIYAFHRYFTCSASLVSSPGRQFQRRATV